MSILLYLVKAFSLPELIPWYYECHQQGSCNIPGKHILINISLYYLKQKELETVRHINLDFCLIYF